MPSKSEQNNPMTSSVHVLARIAPPCGSNQFLASLSPAETDAVAPHLKYVELTCGQVLADSGDAIETVYFPSRGIVSLVVDLVGGQTLEVGMVGRTGILG